MHDSIIAMYGNTEVIPAVQGSPFYQWLHLDYQGKLFEKKDEV